MKNYELYVYCRRNGVSQDSGRQAGCKAATDQDAIDELRKEIPWLQRFYDEISWNIYCTDDNNRKVI